jgi:2-polyprenyl-6-methoxyphenol hydroxylase-like FAD-dependent oxidoreductase
MDQLHSIVVDQGYNQEQPTKYLNLENLELRALIPIYPKQLRVRREGLRRLLANDVDIRWGSSICDLILKDDLSGCKVVLDKGQSLSAKIVVGCDGTGSWVRRFLCPETWEPQALPLCFIGVVVTLSPDQAAPLQEIDPVTFQGCHSESGVQLFWSIISTPTTNGSGDTAEPFFKAQCCVSWKPKAPTDIVPETLAGRIRKLQELCSTMAPPLTKMIDEIPENSETISIKLQDWPCLDWFNYNGRVTLAGDAAHAMTMCKRASDE